MSTNYFVIEHCPDSNSWKTVFVEIAYLKVLRRRLRCRTF